MTKHKSSTRSKTHAYMNIINWIPGGSCAFFERPCHSPSMGYNKEMYRASIQEELKREKSLTVFESNIQKHKSV